MLDTLSPHTPHTPLCACAPPWGRTPRKSIRKTWLVIVGLQDVADLNMTNLHAGKPGQR